MSYVDGGYAVALSTVFAYGIALVLRRRRWERAVKVVEESEEPAAPGPRP